MQQYTGHWFCKWGKCSLFTDKLVLLSQEVHPPLCHSMKLTQECHMAWMQHYHNG